MSSKAEFDIQYNLNYIARLEALEKLVIENPEIEEYGVPIKHLKDDLSEESIVIAIFFLSSALKHSILEDSRERERVATRTYLSKDAKYFIEDSSGRLEIKFKEGFSQLKMLVTGMVLGFIGFKDDNNVFWCSNVVFPKKELSAAATEASGASGSVLMISNPEINHTGIARLMVLTAALHKRITCILLIGNLFSSDMAPPMLSVFNVWLATLKVPVYIVPSNADPTTRALPQDPLPVQFFDSSLVNPLPNPSQASIGGIMMAVMGWEIPSELAKYVLQNGARVQKPGEDYRMHLDGEALASYKPDLKVGTEDILDILEQLVRLRHLVPCAPDTIESVPFKGVDPFLLGFVDVMVAGGAQSAGDRWFGRTRLICLPDFKSTGIALLYDPTLKKIKRIECSV